MKIKTAQYVSGTVNPDRCPPPRLPEFAFIGRSNVGKSSLINLLTGNGKLALTSQNPGKTILINHFIINETWYLVDLPGYGFAKRSKKQQEDFIRMIRRYVLERENLYCLFVLIDANIPPQTIDMDFINWLGEHEVPFRIVYTKADKSKPAALNRNIQAIENKLLETWEELPPNYVVSARNGTGREELLDGIDEIIREVGVPEH